MSPQAYPLCFPFVDGQIVKCVSIPFDKAKPLLDSFQSSYKDNFRFVAGLFFIYHSLILFSYAASVGYGQFYVYLGIQLTVMIILHFVMQPHRVQCHNILDVLLFSNLAAINTLSLYKFGISYKDSKHFATDFNIYPLSYCSGVGYCKPCFNCQEQD